MVPFGSVTHTPLSTIRVDDRDVRVTLHTAHDGIELVGRLFFAEHGWTDSGIPDRGALPGRSQQDVERLACDLRPEELAQRYRRAQAEKRRFHGLRRLTRELLSKIRYVNQVAVSARTGLLDQESVSQEMDLTEQQMEALVRQVRHLAGIEG